MKVSGQRRTLFGSKDNWSVEEVVLTTAFQAEGKSFRAPRQLNNWRSCSNCSLPGRGEVPSAPMTIEQLKKLSQLQFCVKRGSSFGSKDNWTVKEVIITVFFFQAGESSFGFKDEWTVEEVVLGLLVVNFSGSWCESFPISVQHFENAAGDTQVHLLWDHCYELRRFSTKASTIVSNDVSNWSLVLIANGGRNICFLSVARIFLRISELITY